MQISPAPVIFSLSHGAVRNGRSLPELRPITRYEASFFSCALIRACANIQNCREALCAKRTKRGKKITKWLFFICEAQSAELLRFLTSCIHKNALKLTILSIFLHVWIFIDLNFPLLKEQIHWHRAFLGDIYERRYFTHQQYSTTITLRDCDV